MFIRGATCHGEILAGVLGILVLRPVAHVCQLVYQKVSCHMKTRVHEVTLCVHFITLSSLPHCLYVFSF